MTDLQIIDARPQQRGGLELEAVGVEGRAGGGHSLARLGALARTLAWVCFLVIAALSLVPGELRPHTFLPGPAEHFVAYGGAGFMLAFGYWPTRLRILGWLVFAVASCAFEVLQHFSPQRSPSVLDALASSGGLTCGVLCGALVLFHCRRESDMNA